MTNGSMYAIAAPVQQHHAPWTAAPRSSDASPCSLVYFAAPEAPEEPLAKPLAATATFAGGMHVLGTRDVQHALDWSWLNCRGRNSKRRGRG
jgi:hypothetical protein